MEGTEEISCLQIKPGEIGLIKEAPTKRWLDGQKIWDARYKNDAKKVMKSKAHYEAKVEKMLKNALAQGLVHDKSTAEMSEDETLREVRSGTMRKSSIGEIQSERRWGPLDLQGERPPATAIAGRRDSVTSLNPCFSSPFINSLLLARSSRPLEEDYLPHCTCNAQDCTETQAYGSGSCCARSQR